MGVLVEVVLGMLVGGAGTRRGVSGGVGGSGAGMFLGMVLAKSRGGRARNTPRGSRRGAGADDGLTDCERAVLKGPWQNVFTEYPFHGPTVPSSRESASTCFERFFTDEAWTLLVTETNRYVAQCRAEGHGKGRNECLCWYAHGDGHLQVATSFQVLVYHPPTSNL